MLAIVIFFEFDFFAFLIYPVSMRLIDTHCHPQMGEYDADRAEMITRSLDAGIGLIAIGTNLEDSLAGVRLAEQYPNTPVYAAIGVHPTDETVGDISPKHLEALLGSKKIVGIGETGLDYYRLEAYDLETRDVQADVFEQHILVAKEARLPLIIHCRDKNGSTEAYENAAVILRRHGGVPFVMHCFGGTWADAQPFLDLGGWISVTGILTFPKSESLQEVVKNMPLDRLMVETDAPFLAPVPNRGKRNEPAWVERVAQAVADVRGISVDEVAKITTDNAKRFFRLPADA